jgi:hypothetical protein
LKEDAAGDPMSDLKWTKKTTRKISEELTINGIKVGPNTVAKLMKDLKYSLKTNQKTIEAGKRKPGHAKRRNKQFEKIKFDRKIFSKKGLPIISVDSKKKELIGNFKNNGRTWRKKAKKVNDHDFKKYSSGVAVPYGIYDTEKNKGMVVMGISYETPAFAVDSIVTWWNMVGKNSYQNADEIMILSDCGGGNSSRSRVWKRDLQEKLCNKFGISVTVRHYPPGASKWNPIEHRYFSEISKNWSGVPLNSYETALNYIRTTKTKTGLKSQAILKKIEYKKGQKVTDQEMKKIKIFFHKEQPEWNYTIKPQN